ncbi:hypothetical protein IVB45_05775 [Bradyrhizobium sp. 4]|uniref:transposase n=1 Tax=unclassified Bradyrhizobium TaxID=2631580 RepID=UPI001FFA00B9|nr:MULTISPECIES: transposase [unclassified Bradyrhizobium]MCK1396786.1 hypothetical protein [Bradyrhizobium sp. 39]MCK1629241.1 hypothetical protein [Bradyrhizobium sp. 162]MCK1751387.1 hypothetical protein [Bradyrhizobium sp. 135]UPJ36428.1 hypothetical protein IVB45_05775 [Bradyrhizobium sp. 4]
MRGEVGRFSAASGRHRSGDQYGEASDCFRDHRRPDLVEHALGTLIGEQIFCIALRYEDLKITTNCGTTC